jgi:YD repeat-containing protein
MRYDTLSRPWRSSQFQTAVTECPDSDLTCSVTLYDGLGRTSSYRNPDGFFTNYSYIGSRQSKRSVTLKNGSGSAPAQIADTIERSDVFGRLAQVIDPTVTTGLYTYDAVGHMTQATVKGVVSGSVHSQDRKFSYDQRGFLTREEHPENGAFNYTNDARGHVLTKSRSGASADDLRYVYDGAERLTELWARIATTADFRQFKTFAYATSSTATDLALGKLQVAVRNNYDDDTSVTPAVTHNTAVAETYHYLAAAGHLTDRTTEISYDGVLKQRLTQSVAYNAFGLVATTTYPGCSGTESTRAGCSANPNWGSIDRKYVEGRTSNVVPFAGFDYAYNGMLTKVSHTNNVTETITPSDNGLTRPKSISVWGDSACTAPSIVTEPADQTIQDGTSVTLAATGNGKGPFTLQWYDAGLDASSTPSAIAGATGWTFTTPILHPRSDPDSATPYRYFVKVWGCASSPAQSRTASVSVQSCPSPKISALSADMTISFLHQVTLTVTASGQGLTYSWYSEDDGAPIATGAFLTTAALTKSTKVYVRVTASCGSHVDSAHITVSVVPPPPINLSTTFSADGVDSSGVARYRMTAQWTPSAGGNVHHQIIERMSANGAWTTLLPLEQSPTSNSTLVTDLHANDARAFRIRAVDSTGVVGVPAIVVGVVLPAGAVNPGEPITLASFNNVVTIISAIRAIAGLNAVTWNSLLPTGVPVPVQGGLIRHEHIAALRKGMDEALAAIGVAPHPYSDQALLDGTLVRAFHLNELRSRVQ